MTQEEILEGNKLIAEFMGLKVHKNGMCDDPTKGVPSPSFGLKYHSSWDWLMPVVEKIEGDEVDLNISVVIKKNKCGIYGHKNSPYEIQLFLQESKSKKEAVWLAVVEFIKCYNQQ